MKLERLALIAGAGLFLWLLNRIGLAAVGSALSRIGWGFAAILLLEGAVVLLTTLGWRQTLPRESRVPFSSLLAMRMAGDGVNALAPAAVVGGELVRAGLLTRFVGGAPALGSVALAAFTQFLSQVLFVGAGAIAVRAGGLQPRLRLLGLALMIFLFALVAAVLRLARERNGFDGPPRRLAEWLKRLLARSGSAGRLWEGAEREILGAFRVRRGRLALSLLFFLGGWIVSIVEVFLALAFLGAPVSFSVAFSIAVMAVLLEGALFFVPARAGVAEGGLYAIFGALGLDPVNGFFLGLTRRLRELSWGLLGLGALAVLRRSRPFEDVEPAGEGPVLLAVSDSPAEHARK